MARRYVYVSLGKPRIELLLKSNLADEIRRMMSASDGTDRHWTYCCQINAVSGRIQMFSEWSHVLIKLGYFLIVGVSVDEVGDFTVAPLQEYEILPEDYAVIRRDVSLAIHDNWVWFKREAKFVMWLEVHSFEIDGLTCEDAISYLEANAP